jgi:hypothetical protein
VALTFLPHYPIIEAKAEGFLILAEIATENEEKSRMIVEGDEQ